MEADSLSEPMFGQAGWSSVVQILIKVGLSANLFAGSDHTDIGSILITCTGGTATQSRRVNRNPASGGALDWGAVTCRI